MISRFIVFRLRIGSVVFTADHNLKTERRTIISVGEVDTLSDWDRLINAIIYVESRGNESAIGDRGKAIGCLQIHPICVREVNRILRKNDIPKVYTKQDRYSRAKSIEMFEIMAEQVVYCRELSFEEFCEIVARKWNGGPKGHHKKATIKYWEKVREAMTASKK